MTGLERLLGGCMGWASSWAASRTLGCWTGRRWAAGLDDWAGAAAGRWAGAAAWTEFGWCRRGLGCWAARW
ncbi:UNVERIFIED_CONTAM: hypothetical protein Sangu_2411900 [Sesamum angustifolium]|uniref:Uncharacterized protein n=1 Tax=Sesamum angustifolium TaxID=2727405 RepID=A0AAW2KX36_9LAMI